MQVLIRPMQPDDIAAVLRVWHATSPGNTGSIDSPELLLQFLMRNPHTNFLVHAAENILGFILCGHDGRRGVIHHLVVRGEFRRRGLGKALVQQAYAGLLHENVTRLHVFFRGNESLEGRLFWKALGCRERSDTVHLSILLADE